MPEVFASLFAADPSALEREIETVSSAGVDGLHWDVMDGDFVPNFGFSPRTIGACRASTNLPFEVHLMVREPERHIVAFADAGCDVIIIHVEACAQLRRTLSVVTATGRGAGVALNPETPPSAVQYVLDLVDVVLVMSTVPGSADQPYIPSTDIKLRELRDLIRRAERRIRLEADGGINAVTGREAVSAGADVLVAGRALFAHSAHPRVAVDAIRGS